MRLKIIKPWLLSKLSRPSILSGCLGMVVWLLLAAGTTGKAEEIHAAAQDGDLPKVKLLIQAQPSLVSNPGPFGATPLHLAAAFGYPDMVQFLILGTS